MGARPAGEDGLVMDTLTLATGFFFFNALSQADGWEWVRRGWFPALAVGILLAVAPGAWSTVPDPGWSAAHGSTPASGRTTDEREAAA